MRIRHRAVCAEREPEGGAVQPLTCEQMTCLNGGACVQSYHGYTCQCAEGYDGPRCQNTKISFGNSGYGWFDTIGKTRFMTKIRSTKNAK